jgi:hypothetical protein
MAIDYNPAMFIVWIFLCGSIHFDEPFPKIRELSIREYLPTSRPFCESRRSVLVQNSTGESLRFLD